MFGATRDAAMCFNRMFIHHSAVVIDDYVGSVKGYETHRRVSGGGKKTKHIPWLHPGNCFCRGRSHPEGSSLMIHSVWTTATLIKYIFKKHPFALLPWRLTMYFMEWSLKFFISHQCFRQLSLFAQIYTRTHDLLLPPLALNTASDYDERAQWTSCGTLFPPRQDMLIMFHRPQWRVSE